VLDGHLLLAQVQGFDPVDDCLSMARPKRF